MGFARWLSERVDLAPLTPQNDLTSTGYCLANPGSEYLVYHQHGGGGSFSLKLESAMYAVEWADLADGRIAKAGDLQAEPGNMTFQSPFDGPSILHLRTVH
jgi:hypothetical protein